MNFLWSLISGRIGHIRISSLTMKNVMVRRSALSAVGQSVIFLTTVPAPAVMPQNLFCTKTTAPKDNSSVRFVIQDSHRMKVASPLSNYVVHTVETLWFQRKTASTLSSISVSIPNALTISTTSKKWIRMT